MPVRYFINPDLNILLYIYEGITNISKFYEIGDLADADERRAWPMLNIHYFSPEAELDFEAKDMFKAIDYFTDTNKKGLDPGLSAVITQSKGIHMSVKSVKMFPSKSPIKMDAFYSLEEAITSLGLTEKREEILQFFEDSISTLLMEI